MVQANRANRNTKIQTPLSCPASPKIEVQCTLPGRGRRIGLRAGYRASEGHAGRAEAGRARAALRA
jgi:hypothetical protein